MKITTLLSTGVYTLEVREESRVTCKVCDSELTSNGCAVLVTVEDGADCDATPSGRHRPQIVAL